MRRKSLRLLAAFTCTALLVAACSDDEEKSEDTTAGTTADTTTEDTTEDTTETTTAVDTAWMVNTDDCIDPDSANAVIEGEFKIGSVMPLTGDTSADEAFAPSKDGWLVLDFGDIIFHVFRTEARKFYDLDGLWADAPRIDLDLE